MQWRYLLPPRHNSLILFGLVATLQDHQRNNARQSRWLIDVTLRLRGHGSKSCDPEYSPGKPRDTHGVGSHKITYPTPQYALGNGPDFRIVFYIESPDAQRGGRYELNVWGIHTILSNIALNNNLINNSLWTSSVNKPKYQPTRNSGMSRF